MIRPWRVATILTLGLIACRESAGPSRVGTGGLALEIIPSAPGSAALDSGYVRLTGAKDTTIKAVPGEDVRIDRLPPGTYAVGLEGFAGGGVAYFGQTSGVTVDAGRNTTATVVFTAFSPTINAMPTYTVDGRFLLVYSKVPSATGYVVQKDSLAGFSTSRDTLIAVADTSVTVSIPTTGPFYVRVRATDLYGVPGKPSAARSITTLTSVVVIPSNVDTLIGAGDTVRLAASGRDAKNNVISGLSFTWVSSNTSVATVNGAGLVTAVTNGSSTITATGPASKSSTATFKAATVVAALQTSINYVQPNQTIPASAMSMASNGSFYYAIWDGGSPSVIKRYTLSGALLDTTSVPLDARALLYNARDGKFYVKIYGQNLYQVNPSTGDTTRVFTGSFAYNQSHPGISPDGLTYYEHEDSTVRVIDALTGNLRVQYKAQLSAYPAGEAAAADAGHVFTWDGSRVYMYDLQLRLITTFTVPNGTYGFTLSYANGLLWTTNDIPGGSSGTWYGYRLVKQ